MHHRWERTGRLAWLLPVISTGGDTEPIHVNYHAGLSSGLEMGYSASPMCKSTRYLVFAACLALLAAPSAWACDELMGGMPGCSEARTARSSTEGACHEVDDQTLMDCCVAHPSTDSVMSARVEADTSLLSLDVSSYIPTGTLITAEHPRGTSSKRVRWREPERYALFSSYLI